MLTGLGRGSNNENKSMPANNGLFKEMKEILPEIQ
jgi:hypothetical protein